MKGIFQIGIVLAVCLLGEFINIILPLPIPTSVLSMILLFILLLVKIIKIRHIEQFGDFLLKNMAFFFIPAGVAVIKEFDLLKNNLIPFLVICCVSTVVTFLVTAYTVKGVMALQKRMGGTRHE
ncbi:MAG: CidA/LrgA family protein [Christensenella sp.]|uniref:CidA/LrgA family protein n=1 Tax=Christensenella sp. TaxID=1935934 RepID=UPI002B20E107|nr:CidA/LrgA family protein [Christensenella sp.]MEA5002762.1 CidA/LrgA family protein [Christensenella sp.]